MYASGGFYPHEIDQSLRFNYGDSPYLNRMPSSAGNRKTYTYSVWAKRGTSTVYPMLFSTRDPNDSSSNPFCTFHHFMPTGDLRCGIFNTTGTVYGTNTVAVFRDYSAWYHIVFAVDTTQSTSTDRVKIYVNGVKQSVTGTAPPQNMETAINSIQDHWIGTNEGTHQWFDGYMAEAYFVDGQALDASSFGETKSGVWIPKEYAGTYGTNGFHLDFGNSGSLGADVSGNGNNWTPNNLASTDQMLDSPTNNWATLNPLDATNGTFAEGNLKFSASASGHQMASSSLATSFNSGKWYAEFLISAVGGTYPHIGITPVNTSNSTFVGNNGYGYRSDGQKQILSVTSAYGASYAAGDIIGVAFDADSGSITYYKNGTSQGVASSSVDTSTSWRISNSLNATGGIALVNFGQDSSFAGNKTRQGNTDANGIGDFYYSVPSGYLALCTANLPDPVEAIDPALDASPQDYFNTVTYTGNSSAQSITGVGFQPDFVWIKSRSVAVGHSLMDAVRGADADAYIPLASNSNTSESTFNSSWHSQFGGMSAIGSDGFTVFDGTDASLDTFNGLSDTYVAWNWKAGGAGVTNNVGGTTSTVSANEDLGISIVAWTGNSTATSTVGTGLSSSKPLDMVIIRQRDAAKEWQVGHRFSGQGSNFAYHLRLDENFALSSTSPYNMGSQSTTNGDRIYLSTESRTQNALYIAYAFQSVEGFSKFGSYTGNGSTDGPFVYTGFRPAFVMIKQTNDSRSWVMIDSKRGENNVVDESLKANASNAEQTGTDRLDIVSNGFKLRTTAGAYNGLGNPYIYMAFAEMPFKYANAR